MSVRSSSRRSASCSSKRNASPRRRKKRAASSKRMRSDANSRRKSGLSDRRPRKRRNGRKTKRPAKSRRRKRQFTTQAKLSDATKPAQCRARARTRTRARASIQKTSRKKRKLPNLFRTIPITLAIHKRSKSTDRHGKKRSLSCRIWSIDSESMSTKATASQSNQCK